MSKRSPRLLFTKEEREQPELKKVIRKADRRMGKLEKAGAKIPKEKKASVETAVDAKSGKVTTKLVHGEKPRPPSKLSHAVWDAPGAAVLGAVHREIRRNEDDNVGVEGARVVTSSISFASPQAGKLARFAAPPFPTKSYDFAGTLLEGTAEGSARAVQYAHRSHQLRPYRNAARAEARADKANLRALEKQAQVNHPELASNPYSKWQQRRAIKKQYAAAKAGKSAQNTVKASEATAKAARKAAEESKKAGSFVVRHRKGLLIIGGLALVVVMLLNMMSSCSVMFQGVSSGVAMSTYPCEDADMLAAEAQYCGMEAELQEKLDNYEADHDYDEYHYELDSIEHDPYVLISMLTALQGGEWTIEDVQGTLAMLFEKQYILTETVEVEVRYRTETRTGTHTITDPETGETSTEDYEYDVEVAYNYYICTVTLENFNLSHVPVYIMGEEQLSMYAIYMASLGNRPDLFPDSAYINKYINGNYTDYDIPPEALEDEVFAAMIKEAEKYLGYPYVWGGSSPATSFDCSGFVSWVINHSGWDVGRLGADGLCNICTPVSAANAKPGDLVFFVGTYDTPGASHVGIYVGNSMMIHCGDPISYSNLNSSYWQAHFYCYGRLPGN